MKAERSLKNPKRAGSSYGFSLVELMAALLLTVITIMGLAYTLGMGNGFIDRYATARAALAQANGQIEHVRGQIKDGQWVAALPFDSLTNGTLNGVVIVPGVKGTMHTHIEGENDVDGPLLKLTATVSWTQGGMGDSIGISTLVCRP